MKTIVNCVLLVVFFIGLFCGPIGWGVSLVSILISFGLDAEARGKKQERLLRKLVAQNGGES